MAVSVNHAGYERRLAVVEQLVHSLGLEPSNISTIAYTDQYPYPFNNFLYKVELAKPATSSVFPGTQPGTVAVPPSDGVSALVVKLSNLAVESANGAADRVQNDVVMQHLVRQSVAQRGLPPLVPAVYAWASATTTDGTDEKGFGWILSELRSGVDLDSELSSLALEDKKQVLGQIADILAAIQSARLPDGVTNFGPLAIDASSGDVVSGQVLDLAKNVLPPVDSYAAWRLLGIRKHLELAASSSAIQGWKSNGVDARIEQFLAAGGPEKVLAGVDLHRKGIIHADFTTNNMLFDKDTKKITAILDFDWSYISHPFHEFPSALNDLGCNIPLNHGDNSIPAALLSGNFPTPAPADGLDEKGEEEGALAEEKWQVAKAWHAAMKKSGVVAPSDIPGTDKILDLTRFQSFLAPYQLGNADELKKMDGAKQAELRAKTEADLVQWLEKHGY